MQIATSNIDRIDNPLYLRLSIDDLRHLARLKAEITYQLTLSRIDMLDWIHDHLKRTYTLSSTVEATGYDLMLRLVVYFLTASWFACYPAYLLIIHMKAEKFFSYDLFVEGVLGIKSFIMICGILIALSSIFLWGFMLFFRAAAIQKDKGYIWGGAFFFLMAIGAHYVLLHGALVTGFFDRYLWIAGLGFVFIASIATYFDNPLKKIVANWIVPLIGIALSALAPIVWIDTASDIVKTGLENFKVGGNVSAIVYKTEDNAKVAEGRLLLLTPKYVYLRSGSTGYTSIARTDATYVEVN